MKASYPSGIFRLSGPKALVHVTVDERFLLTELDFLFQAREYPWWLERIGSVRRFFGPGRVWRLVNRVIDWWILRENRRVLGGVRICELKIGNEDQLAENVRVPALAFDGKPLMKVPVAHPGTRISVGLDGTAPEPIAVLFVGHIRDNEESVH